MIDKLCYHFVLHRLRTLYEEHLTLDNSPNNAPSPDLVTYRRILTEGLSLYSTYVSLN